MPRRCLILDDEGVLSLMDVTHLTDQMFPDKVEIQVHEDDWLDYQDTMERFQSQQDWLLEEMQEMQEKQKAK